MKTEREKMLAGELYDPLDADLIVGRSKARNLLREFNASGDSEKERRATILRELLGSSGENVWIEPPFFCDYGEHITVGNRVFFNFNCVVLDSGLVTIGDDVMFAPACKSTRRRIRSIMSRGNRDGNWARRSSLVPMFGSAAARSFVREFASARAP